MRSRCWGPNNKAEAITFFDLEGTERGLRGVTLKELVVAENQRTIEKQRGAPYVDDCGSVGPQTQAGRASEFDDGVFRRGSRAEIQLKLDVALIATKNNVGARIKSAVSDRREMRIRAILRAGRIYTGRWIRVDEAYAQETSMGLDDDETAALQFLGRRFLLLENDVCLSV